MRNRCICVAVATLVEFNISRHRFGSRRHLGGCFRTWAPGGIEIDNEASDDQASRYQG